LLVKPHQKLNILETGIVKFALSRQLLEASQALSLSSSICLFFSSNICCLVGGQTKLGSAQKVIFSFTNQNNNIKIKNKFLNIHKI
jgi:hypothetical protein